LPTKEETDEENESDEDEGTDKPEDDEERDMSSQEHWIEEGDQRDQLQRNGSWIREREIQGGGEVRHRSRMDGDQTQSQPGRTDDTGTMADHESGDMTEWEEKGETSKKKQAGSTSGEE
jgi:hypothetical protein